MDTMGFVEGMFEGLDRTSLPCLMVQNVENWKWDGAAWGIMCTRSFTLENALQTALYSATMSRSNPPGLLSQDILSFDGTPAVITARETDEGQFFVHKDVNLRLRCMVKLDQRSDLEFISVMANSNQMDVEGSLAYIWMAPFRYHSLCHTFEFQVQAGRQIHANSPMEPGNIQVTWNVVVPLSKQAALISGVQLPSQLTSDVEATWKSMDGKNCTHDTRPCSFVEDIGKYISPAGISHNILFLWIHCIMNLKKNQLKPKQSRLKQPSSQSLVRHGIRVAGTQQKSPNFSARWLHSVVVAPHVSNHGTFEIKMPSIPVLAVSINVRHTFSNGITVVLVNSGSSPVAVSNIHVTGVPATIRIRFPKSNSVMFGHDRKDGLLLIPRSLDLSVGETKKFSILFEETEPSIGGVKEHCFVFTPFVHRSCEPNIHYDMQSASVVVAIANTTKANPTDPKRETKRTTFLCARESVVLVKEE